MSQTLTQIYAFSRIETIAPKGLKSEQTLEVLRFEQKEIFKSSSTSRMSIERAPVKGKIPIGPLTLC